MGSSSNVSQLLLSLSETDGEYFQLFFKKNNIEKEKQTLEQELESSSHKLAELEKAYEDEHTRQLEEETRLKDEQQKIVDRRKQLSDLGGAKAGKLVEREIDIASRALETLEEKTLKAISDADQVQTQIDSIKENISSIQEKLESFSNESSSELEEVSSSLKKISTKRDGLLKKLDERIHRLYERVIKRYPGAAVSTALEGACQSCFRALPPQTYNQVLAGNLLIQCPGCSRILVNDPNNKEATE